MTEQELQRHIDGLAKPPGSLGAIETLAIRLGAIQRTTAPQTKPRRIVLFAADHGVVAAGGNRSDGGYHRRGPRGQQRAGRGNRD
jgi:nicotinate-nucleotide--dimethylbenzimidazole phosphoribosyltransferase